MTTDIYQLEQVNKLAKRQRHLKVLGASGMVEKYFDKLTSGLVAPFDSIKNFWASIRLLPIAPHKRLLSDAIILGVVLFALSAVSPLPDFATTPLGYATDYMDSYALPGDVLITDNEGYLMKINPQTGTASKIGMTDYAMHTVQVGENLSSIAKSYGLKAETIMWENNISNANSIRAGTDLVIPPVDGISYTVVKNDTLASLSKKYSISSDNIIAQNQLSSDVITIGQTLFLPGARPIAKSATIARSTGRTVSTSSAYSTSNLSDSDSVPIGDKPFIYPTNGSITQGYRAGHYALDIANRSRPAIWAAAAGTVVTASSGTWGGGYGNHVIIDHGNGIQTLYAHLDHLEVQVGDYVDQGQVLGQMGNTGRVYGATGIHLHWEVRKNGVKQNPGNYY